MRGCCVFQSGVKLKIYYITAKLFGGCFLQYLYFSLLCRNVIVRKSEVYVFNQFIFGFYGLFMSCESL